MQCETDVANLFFLIIIIIITALLISMLLLMPSVLVLDLDIFLFVLGDAVDSIIRLADFDI
jgi:hypothetical protein